MKLNFGIQLEQTQKLIMTPELRQAIKILQLSSFELSDLVGQELEKNPMIESVDEEKEYSNNNSKEDENNKTQEKEEIDWGKYFEHNESYYKGNQKEVRDEEYNPENFVKDSTTLKEHLLFQLHVSVVQPKYKKIGEYVIECINSNGYLTTDAEEISKLLGEEISDVENIITLIQGFDPIGVGARDIKECLSIQLKQMDLWNETLETIIFDYLTELADNRFQVISRKLNISCKEVQDIKDLIKTLEPKPGRLFSDDNNAGYIIPDVYIEKVSGEYVVLVNDATAPRLQINNHYKNILKQEDKSSDTSKYLNEKLDSAMWLVKSIEQRRNTLHRVVTAILEVQKDFFDEDETALKPLTLREIADQLEIHESTVSRATNGKYVQTPKGVFELKYFFNSGIESGSGEVMASTGIKKRIKELIDKEISSKPISDQKIADTLKKHGMTISRRTVAKYRDEMGILSSSKRKRYE